MGNPAPVSYTHLQAIHMRTDALHARADDLAQQRHFLRPRGRIEIYQQLIGLGQVAQARHMPPLARARAPVSYTHL